jgi:hypothetical protein
MSGSKPRAESLWDSAENRPRGFVSVLKLVVRRDVSTTFLKPVSNQDSAFCAERGFAVLAFDTAA